MGGHLHVCLTHNSGLSSAVTFSCIMGSLLQVLLWEIRTHSNMASMLSSYLFSLVVTKTGKKKGRLPLLNLNTKITFLFPLTEILRSDFYLFIYLFRGVSYPLLSPKSSSMGTANMGLSPRELIFIMD